MGKYFFCKYLVFADFVKTNLFGLIWHSPIIIKLFIYSLQLFSES